jgi:hypothetical protein
VAAGIALMLVIGASLLFDPTGDANQSQSWDVDPLPPTDLEQAVNEVFGSGCISASEAEDGVETRLTELGYSDWHVSRGAGVRVDGCVSAMIDTVNRQVRLLMALRPQVKAALYHAANRLLDECMSQEEATSLVSSVLADLDELRWEIQSTGLVGGPLNRLDEVERHVAAGCWVYTGTGWTADGTRLFYIGGKDAR